MTPCCHIVRSGAAKAALLLQLPEEFQVETRFLIDQLSDSDFPFQKTFGTQKAPEPLKKFCSFFESLRQVNPCTGERKWSSLSEQFCLKVPGERCASGSWAPLKLSIWNSIHSNLIPIFFSKCCSQSVCSPTIFPVFASFFCLSCSTWTSTWRRQRSRRNAMVIIENRRF